MNTPLRGTPRTTLMVITGDGNVGIGTTSPVATLDIGGATAKAGGTLHIQEPANPTTISTPAQELTWRGML